MLRGGLAVAILLLASCGNDASTAGMHLCSVVTQAEVDGLLNAAVGVGEHSAPFVNVEVCEWLAPDATLTLRRFPSPDGGLADALGGTVAPLLSDGTAFSVDGSTVAVAVDDGRATLVLELTPSTPAEVDHLADVARAAAERSP